MAAVAARSSHNSPHLSSRMSSPKEPKRSTPIKNNEDTKPVHSSLATSQSARKSPPPQADAQERLPKIEGENETNGSNNAASGNTTTTTNAQPLAPPPRPSTTNANEAPDYFSANHNTSHYGIEPNPFETSFANPSAETPGKSLLPPVASLTSPSSLLPGGTPGWANSLRSGPLSPAMLTGPASAADYFDPHFRNSFPTPNESSLRTGLTPGGGGSMFPAPSPNSQALFNQLQSGGATPGTLDFRQAAMNAAAVSKRKNNFPVTSNPTTQPEVSSSMQGGEQQQYQTSAAQPDPQDPFGQHDTDAANGLYMLAQNGGRNANRFAVPNQPANIQTNTQQMNHAGNQSQQTSPLTKRAGRNSLNSINTGSGDNIDLSESETNEQAKPATRSRGKKGGAKAGSKRKAEEPPAKAPANRRSKVSMSSEPPDADDMMDTDDENQQDGGEKGRKMTDEEKRKNFLERNRVAALKCRQRKKQWLANLQAKVELFSTENDALSATVTQLREEIVNLKSLLLAHKECAVSQAQGLSGANMHNFIESTGNFQPHNPYGMAMGGPNGLPPGMQLGMPPQGGPPPGMQRS